MYDMRINWRTLDRVQIGVLIKKITRQESDLLNLVIYIEKLKNS